MCDPGSGIHTVCFRFMACTCTVKDTGERGYIPAQEGHLHPLNTPSFDAEPEGVPSGGWSREQDGEQPHGFMMR